MRVSEIVKSTDATRRIVKMRSNRRGRRHADLLGTITSATEELKQLAGVGDRTADVGLEEAINGVVSAVSRLRAVYSASHR